MIRLLLGDAAHTKSLNIQIKDIRERGGFVLETMRFYQVFNSKRINNLSSNYRTSDLETLHFDKNEVIWVIS